MVGISATTTTPRQPDVTATTSRQIPIDGGASVKASATVKPSVLSGDLDRLAARLRTSLAASPDSRSLQTLFEQLDLVEKLLNLKLSPEEYQRLQSLDAASMTAGWASFLGKQLAQDARPSPSFDRLQELAAALPKLQRFYETASRRDEVLVERAMAKLAETKEPLAVLITGGFHSPRITQLLKDRGVGVVVVAPRVSHETDERLYRAVLKYKSGYGSFDDVQAALHQATAAEGVSQPPVSQ